jgi:molybdopterin synthase sulfur carrier subunit
MVRVRLFAALREAAGTSELTVEPGRLGEILDGLSAKFGTRFANVLGYASVLVDGERLRDRDTEVPDGAELALLPPFSGGSEGFRPG